MSGVASSRHCTIASDTSLRCSRASTTRAPERSCHPFASRSRLSAKAWCVETAIELGHPTSASRRASASRDLVEKVSTMSCAGGTPSASSLRARHASVVDLPEPGHAATQSDAFCGESTTESWKRSRRTDIVQTRGGRATEPEAKRSAD